MNVTNLIELRKYVKMDSLDKQRKENPNEARTLSSSTIKELKSVLVNYPLVGRSLAFHLKENHQLSCAINNCYMDIIDELLSAQQLSGMFLTVPPLTV